MWDCQPPQCTQPLLPLTLNKEITRETRGQNKCPFVMSAWKLWSQHKLILVSEVVQTIVWILSRWESFSRVSEGHKDKSEKDLVSLVQADNWGRSYMCLFSCHNSFYKKVVLLQHMLKYKLLHQVRIVLFDWFNFTLISHTSTILFYQQVGVQTSVKA